MPRRSVIGLILGLMLAWGLGSSTLPPMPAGFLSAYHWQGTEDWFGGFSAINVAADGLSFTTVSDRAYFTSGRLIRDAAGRITQVLADPLRKLQDKNGKPLGEFASDSEGLAITPGGTAYVSFERVTRVARYPALTGPSEPLRKHPDFKAMDSNASLETLAIDADDTLYTLPERPANGAQSFPVYRYKNGVWDQPFALPKRGFFLAVDADFGPDGRFYLLERQFDGLAGFASRVRRFTVGADGIANEETLFQSVPGQHDNLEGLSVWRDASGALRLTMISDDNLLFLQRTEIVEYRVPD